MYNEKNQNSDFSSGRSADYLLMQSSLTTGPGEAFLQNAPKIHQLLMVQGSHPLTPNFNPNNPMAAKMSYM